MVMLDTNIILRYLLNDNKEMADKAEQYINAGNVEVTIEVIAEAVYVLGGIYSMEKGLIVNTIKEFLNLVECSQKDVLKVALDTYAVHKLDFVDCVLYGYHTVGGYEIATFDGKLLSLLNK